MQARLPILGFGSNRRLCHRQSAIIGAAAGFYYFKVILAIYTTEGATEEPLKVSISSKAIAVTLAVVIIVLGLYLKPLQKVLASAGAVPVAIGK